MKKINKLFILFILGMCTLVVVGCGVTKELDESIINEEIVSKGLNINEKEVFADTKLVKVKEVTEITINNHKISDDKKSDIVYADITFNNDVVEYKGSFELTYNYNNKGEWKLDSSTATKKCDRKIIKLPTEEEVITCIQEHYYSSYKNNTNLEICDMSIVKDEKSGEEKLHVDAIESSSSSRNIAEFTISFIQEENLSEPNELKLDSKRVDGVIGCKYYLNGSLSEFKLSKEDISNLLVNKAINQGYGKPTLKIKSISDINEFTWDGNYNIYSDEYVKVKDLIVKYSDNGEMHTVKINSLIFIVDNGNWTLPKNSDVFGKELNDANNTDKTMSDAEADTKRIEAIKKYDKNQK